MRKLLGLVVVAIAALTSIAASCGGIPGPQPTPTPVPMPTPTPTPTPVPAMTLHAQGNRLVKVDGSDPRLLGSIIGCHIDGVSGWPLVCKESLVEIAKAGLNWTHVRTGPFTAEAEAPEFAFYEKGAGGKYDLSKVNQDFIGRLRTRIKDALDLGIYVEVDLPIDRWPTQHRVSPWQAENNIQGEEHSGLDIFQRAPDSVHEAAVLAVVMSTCEFPNVIYSLGNESFKSDSGAFSSRMVALIRQLCPGRPIGSNSAEGAAVSDYTILHQNAASGHVANGHPVEVNEFAEPGPTPSQVISEAQKADAAGTYYMYWRGSHTTPQWLLTMAALGEIRAGQPVPTPQPEICSRPDFASGEWSLVCTRKPDPNFPTLPLCPANEAQVFASQVTVAEQRVAQKHPTWVTSGCLNDLSEARVVEYLDAAAEEFQAQGVCAWHDHDAVQAQQTATRWHELHLVAFGSGCLAAPDQAMVKVATGPVQPLPGPTPAPTPTPPPPTPSPGACPIPAPGDNWLGDLKPHGGQLLDLTPWVGNPTGIKDQPWIGCLPRRCPLAVEKGPVAAACADALFRTPVWSTSGGSCTIIPQESSSFTVKVATGSCALFAKGDVPDSAQLGPWEVSATSPACHVGSDGLCH